MRKAFLIIIISTLTWVFPTAQTAPSEKSISSTIHEFYSDQINIDKNYLDPFFFETDLNGDGFRDLIAIAQQPKPLSKEQKEFAGCKLIGPHHYLYNKDIILPAMIVLHGTKKNGWRQPTECFLILNSVHAKWELNHDPLDVTHLKLPRVKKFSGTSILMLDYEGIGSYWFWDGETYREDPP